MFISVHGFNRFIYIMYYDSDIWYWLLKSIRKLSKRRNINKANFQSTNLIESTNETCNTNSNLSGISKIDWNLIKFVNRRENQNLYNKIWFGNCLIRLVCLLINIVFRKWIHEELKLICCSKFTDEHLIYLIIPYSTFSIPMF